MQLINFNDASSVLFILSGATCVEKLLRLAGLTGCEEEGLLMKHLTESLELWVTAETKARAVSADGSFMHAQAHVPATDKTDTGVILQIDVWVLQPFCRSKSRIKCASLELSFWDDAGEDKETENKGQRFSASVSF